MYTQLLTRGNTEFATAVHRRGWNVHPTQALREVLTAVSQCQAGLTQVNLGTLLTRLFTWRTNQRLEYQDRGVTNGVGYRLWMEAKQLLRNRFGRAYTDHADPPEPAGCPGTMLMGTYVPPGEGQMEICHAFSYRWLVASGHLPGDGNPSPTTGPFNGGAMRPILFPFPRPYYPPVRVGGVLQVQAGDVIGFFDPQPANPAPLAHSLVAKDATHWYGANNLGCFGNALGRAEMDMNHYQGRWLDEAGHPDDRNRWQTPTGASLVVVYRRDFA